MSKGKAGSNGLLIIGLIGIALFLAWAAMGFPSGN